MYSLIRAMGVKQSPDAHWFSIDIDAMEASALLTEYRKVYAVLTHPLLHEELTIDLDELAIQLAQFDGTFSDYLLSIGNSTLPTVVGVPTIQRHNLVFSDAFQSDFSVDTIDFNRGDGEDIPEEEKIHLVVRPREASGIIDYDYITLRKRVLANVNGFYHATAANSKGLYVVDGNKTAVKSKRNHLGLMSFATIGDVNQFAIDESMISMEKDSIDGTVDKVHIRIPGDMLTNQCTPILILGGYMLPIDDQYASMTSPNVITVKFFKYPLLDRYFESRDYLDYSGFDVDHVSDNDYWVMQKQLRTEAFLSGYFTMTQSFIYVVPTQNLIFERLYPERQTVPHTFISYEKPMWPLVVGEGKHDVYWSRHEDGQWMINTIDSYRWHRTYHTTVESDRHAVDDGAWMGNAGYYGPAHFLKIYKEEIEIKAV